jgi:hypothetical protein
MYIILPGEGTPCVLLAFVSSIGSAGCGTDDKVSSSLNVGLVG